MTWQRPVACALAALTVAAAVAVSRLEVDNRLERWVETDAAATLRYQQFRERFGSDEFVVVAIAGPSLLDPESLEAMVDVQQRIEAIAGVRRVDGLPAVYRDLFGAEDPEELQIEATSTPFYRGLFISDGGTEVALLAEVQPTEDPGARHRIVRGLREAVVPLDKLGLTVRLVGSTVLADALDEVSAREALRTFPVALVASMMMLALLLRSLRGMLVAALCSGATVVLTLGLMAVADRQLTMVSTALPSLLWVLTLSNCIHVLQRYQRQRERAPVDVAVAAAVAEAVRPCTLAALTTALGFVSLVMADLAPVREVGLFAALGLVISLPINLVLAPELIRLMRVPLRPSAARTGADWSSRLVLRRPKTVVAAAVVVAVVAVTTLPAIRVESNPLTFLPSGHEVAEAYRFVGGKLAGFYSLEVVVESPFIWTDPRLWPVLEQLQGRLASSPVVAKVLGPLDVLRKLRHWRYGFDPADYALPASQNEAEALLSDLDDRGRGLLDRMVADGGRAVRLSAIVNEMDEGRFLELVETTRLAVAELPDGVHGWVTGMVLGLVESQQRLVRSQLSSLGLACCVIFLAILIGLRSWRLMLASVPPNLFPVLVMFAAMAVTRIPLDAATVMVASVALGIAVDNTIHLLAGYDRHRHAGAGPAVAVRATLERVGSALVITSVTAAIGFFSLCLSAFVPIRDFGLLAATTMLVALAADLFLVPALLVARDGS